MLGDYNFPEFGYCGKTRSLFLQNLKQVEDGVTYKQTS